METPYVYVMVRQDLSPEQQLVQASHAALEAGFRFPAPGKNTAHLVMLAAAGEGALLSAARRLEDAGIAHHVFFEPDAGVGYSAWATKPLKGAERKALRRYPLYRARG